MIPGMLAAATAWICITGNIPIISDFAPSSGQRLGAGVDHHGRSDLHVRR